MYNRGMGRSKTEDTAPVFDNLAAIEHAGSAGEIAIRPVVGNERLGQIMPEIGQVDDARA